MQGLSETSDGTPSRESNQADYDRFHNEVYTERGVPSTMMGRWAWHIEIDKRFVVFLHANYADEIAAMKGIAPNYLAITRKVVEGTPQDEATD